MGGLTASKNRYALESYRQSLNFCILLLVCIILAGNFSECFSISVCSLQQVFNPSQACLLKELVKTTG